MGRPYFLRSTDWLHDLLVGIKASASIRVKKDTAVLDCETSDKKRPPLIAGCVQKEPLVLGWLDFPSVLA
jgi:hypothetical protein